VDQMCMAVQSLGLSPNLLRTDKFITGRGLLHSAIRSGLISVLILQQANQAHAVAVAGMKTRPSRPRDSFIGDAIAFIDDRASDLLAIYIHDDRYGPYLRADLEKQGEKLFVRIDTQRDGKHVEAWELTHILVPTHSKVRLSLSTLRNVALRLCQVVNGFRTARLGLPPNEAESSAIKNPELTIIFETMISRNYDYVESLITGEHGLAKAELIRFLSTVMLSRYIGVIRLQAEYLGEVDVIVDTTSTPSNLYFLAIVATKKAGEGTDLLAQHLSHECQCPFIA
jgi:hypothetical protein